MCLRIAKKSPKAFQTNADQPGTVAAVAAQLATGLKSLTGNRRVTVRVLQEPAELRRQENPIQVVFNVRGDQDAKEWILFHKLLITAALTATEFEEVLPGCGV